MSPSPASSVLSRAQRLVVMLAVPLLVVAGWSAAGADESAQADAGVQLVELAPTGDAADISGTATLVTGDKVHVRAGANGRHDVEVEPAARPGGVVPQFTVLEDDAGVYVIPEDADVAIPSSLDRELFNVTKLIDNGYTDGVSVVASDAPGSGDVGARSSARSQAGLQATRALDSVDGFAAVVAPNGRWWAANRADIATANARPGARAATAGTPQKVWLDELLTVALDESVPMVGAPEAWAQGHDGSGQTVAVLDTGVDMDHPDLVGQVVGTRNFTSDSGIADEHGHGTHVAATVAGTGAGSDGQYRGVAPGADLLIGKICGASGTCPTSGTLAAMEWAADRADVISMSIGSNFGTDQETPTAIAVNQLSAEHPDTLFVVAAGNNGGQGPGSVASPGAAEAALTVGAVDKDANLAYFSSRGPRLGDHGIKPDVTAPGVSIVAARGAGTSMGAPVNDLYTAASGTSMATPHVSGAAAIAMQAAPDLTAQQVKAAFVTTGAPHPDLTVFEQGGGLIDIPAAIATPVVATPSPASLGFFAHPQVDTPVAEQVVTWTNRSDADVTLNLALDVANGDGVVPPTEAMSVSPTTVTVPAGDTTTATISLDVNGLTPGDYGGHLLARGGDVNLDVPVGFFVEPEMTELTIHATTRDGSPAGRVSNVFVVDAHQPASGFERLRFEDGVAHGRFRPGDYYVVGVIHTRDGHGTWTQDGAWIAEPTLDLSQDVTLNFDARDAEPIVIDTPAHPDASSLAQFRKMVIGYGGQFRDAENFAPQWLIANHRKSFMLASGQAELGELEVAAMERVARAPLTVDVVAPEARSLSLRPLAGTPDIDMDTQLDLVDVGAGNEADYEGLDVEGKAVLVQRTTSDYLHYSRYEQTARAHGAAAMLMMHDTTGYFVGITRDAQIPSVAITGQDGQWLRDQLAAGDVTVQVTASTWSPYLYDATSIHTGALPDGINETLQPADMVTVHNSFHGEPDEPMSEYRTLWRPYQTFSAAQYSPVLGARERTEYVSAGDGSLYRQQVAGQWVSEARLRERDTMYPEVTEVTHQWFRGAMVPKPFEPAGPRNPGEPILRTGDSLRVRIADFNDTSEIPHLGFWDSTTDTNPIRFWVDDAYLGQASRANIRLDNLPPEQATVRMEMETSRDADWWQTSTETLTNWTFHTARADEPAVAPVLIVDYDTDVDLTNTAVLPRDRGGPATLDLHVRHHVGFSGEDVAGAKMWISYDDGVTWEQRPVKAQAGAGNFRAILDSPAAGDTPTGYATIKVEAWDTADNRIVQEVTRAWRLAER